MAPLLRPRNVATATGLALVALGVLGLLGELPGGLTTLHDAVHLLPGLALAGVGLLAGPGRAQRGVLLGAAFFYAGLSAASALAPSSLPGLLGITAVENLAHVPLAGLLVLAGFELGPFEARISQG